MSAKIPPTKIRSRHPWFKGQLIDKPQTALVIGYDPEEGDIYACPYCGHQATADGCDCVGAEDGNLCCLACNREFST